MVKHGFHKIMFKTAFGTNQTSQPFSVQVRFSENVRILFVAFYFMHIAMSEIVRSVQQDVAAQWFCDKKLMAEQDNQLQLCLF